MYNDNIHLVKRETITNGEKYDFFIYNMLSIEKKLSEGQFGKGDTVISQVKYYKVVDKITGEKLDVKLRCSKKKDDAMEGAESREAKKIFNKCLKQLEEEGLLCR